MRSASGYARPPGGSFIGTNVFYALYQWAIPGISGPTGTMANNGAVTWGTALSNAYTGGAWVAMPAGSIAAGVPAAAAILWYIGTDTTHGTFFNSTYTSGLPTVGTQTAFVTTGPGAFTGLTTEIVFPLLTIPANSMGSKGMVRALHISTGNTAAGAKTVRIYAIGLGNSALTQDLATGGQAGGEILIANRSATNSQINEALNAITAANGASVIYTSVDTTASSQIQYTLQKATATNVLAIEAGAVYVQYSP